MKKNNKLDEKKVCELYISGNSTHQISKLFKVSRAPIHRILRENNISTRRVGHPQIYSSNEIIFKKDDETSFYLAGFIAADGSLRKQKYSKVLKISVAIKDFDHLKMIQSLFENNSKIKIYETKIKNGRIHKNKVNKTKYKYAELTITSSKIFNDLKKFNIIPNKTTNYILPEWLVAHKMFKHFIRGYVDGDGTISSSIRKQKGKKYYTPQVSFSLIGNYHVLNEINETFFHKCQINKAKIVHKPDTKHTYRIRFSGNKQMQKLGKFLYSDATIYLARKHDKIKWLL